MELGKWMSGQVNKKSLVQPKRVCKYTQPIAHLIFEFVRWQLNGQRSILHETKAQKVMPGPAVVENATRKEEAA